MMAERCTLREAATPDEGLDQNQERWLRMKRRLPGAEEDRWKEIYRIVFPADSEELVPSPCKSSNRTSVRAAKHARRLRGT